MRHFHIILTLIAFSSIAFGQESLDFNWKKKQSYKVHEGDVWSVDVLENVYVSHNGGINKYDSTGSLRFSQSIKALGRMTQLVPVNIMRLMHFSEEQQRICFFEKTLSPIEECLDLGERGMANATLISASNQPDKIWILDNLDSRLLLISIKNPQQQQELKNLRGILNIDEITQIVERGNRLFLLDPQKGVYVFDIYGSLLEYVEGEGIRQLDANEQNLFMLKEGEMNIRSLRTGYVLSVKLPVDEVTEFSYRNRCFFFRTSESVHKYALQFSK